MSSYEPAPDTAPQGPTQQGTAQQGAAQQGASQHAEAAQQAEASRGTGARHGGPSPARVGTVVWGLIVLALAALIIIGQLGIVALNGTYVLIGLMIGAGAALVIGGLLSARGRDKETTTVKS